MTTTKRRHHEPRQQHDIPNIALWRFRHGWSHERQRSLCVALIVLTALAPYGWFHVLLLPPSTLLKPPAENHLHPPQRSLPEQQQQHHHNNIHLVFSTGCSPNQNWQSYVFFYHAWRVQQPGNVTRIASCPSPFQRDELTRRHEYEIASTMSHHFHIHTTPDYSFQVMSSSSSPEFRESYPYFNKPFGLRHWMEHELGYPHPSHPETDDMIIGVLDADMILFQPILNNFSSWEPSSLWNVILWNNHNNHNNNTTSIPTTPPRTRVEHGFPMAQEYYWDDWRNNQGIRHHWTHLLPADSAVHNVSHQDAMFSYGAGPPYLLTARDLYAVVTVWCQLVPNIYRVYPQLLAEMFAYSIAAAHLQLKHQLANGFIVSMVTEEREGWRNTIDTIPLPDACQPLSPNSSLLSPPLLLHYCQDYSIGDYWFSKPFIPGDLLSCDAPLLDEPPLDAGVRYNYYVNDQQEKVFFSKRKGNSSSMTQRPRLLRVRQTFATCTMFRALNQAATHYKQHHCGTTTANYHKIMRPE